MVTKQLITSISLPLFTHLYVCVCVCVSVSVSLGDRLTDTMGIKPRAEHASQAL